MSRGPLSQEHREKLSRAMKEAHRRKAAQKKPWKPGERIKRPVGRPPKNAVLVRGADAATAVALSVREMVQEEIRAAFAEIDLAAMVREEFKKAFN